MEKIWTLIGHLKTSKSLFLGVKYGFAVVFETMKVLPLEDITKEFTSHCLESALK